MKNLYTIWIWEKIGIGKFDIRKKGIGKKRKKKINKHDIIQKTKERVKTNEGRRIERKVNA